MYRERQRRKIVIYSLIGILLLMSVAYAAFSQRFDIKGSTKVTSNWDVRITNVTNGTPTGNAENSKDINGNVINPVWDGLSASMSADLYEAGDSMEYVVTISNYGTIDATLDDVILTPSNNSAVIITYTGYAKGQKLYKKGHTNSSVDVKVKVAYNPEYTGGEATGESSISFGFVQSETKEIIDDDIISGDSKTLTYNCEENGGSFNRDAMFDINSDVDLNATCSKEGYTFVGWNTNKDATSGLSSYKMPSSNSTLYGIYKKNIVASFVLQDGDAATLGSASVSCDAYNKNTSCTMKSPTLAAKSGYTVIGFNTNENATTSSLNANTNFTISENTTYFSITKQTASLTATFNKNGATSIGSNSLNCDRYNGADSCMVTAPTITRDGFTITGWNTNQNATASSSGNKAVNSKIVLTSNTNYYAITSKKVTLTFYKNGNTSQTDASGNASTADSVTRDCTIQNSATTCSITAPVMVAASGFTIKGYTTGENTHSNYWTHDTAKDFSADANWYAQSEKASIQRKVTFNKNGNTSFTYNGTKYTDASKQFNLCVIPASYNGASQATSCSATITMPTIEAHSNTPDIIGWSTAAGTHTATYTSGQTNATLTATSNLTYFAQTSSGAAVTLTANWNANGATLSSTGQSSCNLETTYNGTAKANSCMVDAPTITASDDTPTVVGFNTSANSTSNSSNYNASTGKLTLTASNSGTTWYVITKKEKVTLTANWNANNATLSSTAELSCDLDASYNGTAQAISCTVDAPTITAPTNTPTVVGFNTSANSTSNNSSYNTSTKKLTLTSSNTGSTWYAITTKAKVDRKITFNKNGNTSFTYNGTTYTDDSKQFTLCSIPATYNGTAQSNSCTATITMPTIEAHSNTPTIIGWNAASNVHTANYTSGQTNVSLTATSNLTYYAQTSSGAAVNLKANWNANGATLSSTSQSSCDLATTYNGVAKDTSCTVDAPTITRSGFTILGFNTTSDATSNNSSYNTSTKKLTLTSSNTGSTWYAISYKDVTITFDKNGNTSQTDASGNVSTADTVTRSCTIRNIDTTCSVTSPTMVAPSGFTIKGYSIGASTHSGYWNHNTDGDVSDNTTWYAQSEKAAIQRTVTFYKNGNTSFTYNGTKYTDTSKAFNLCKINAVYNGASQATSCSATVTMPTIEAHSNTPDIIGWSTAAGTHTATYTSGQTNVSLTASSNLKYYAQTSSSSSVTLTAKWNANGATLSSTADSSCSLDKTYNGASKATSCTVDAPTVTRDGFAFTGFNTSNSATTNNSSYNTSTGKLTLTSSNTGSTWYAITSKDVTITFYKNGNTSQTDSNGSASTANTVTRSCTIQNGSDSCAITAPTMVAASGFTIKGYTTGENTHSDYWTHGTPKDFSADANWYAQSEKAAIQRTVTFNKNGNTSFTYSGTKYTDTSKAFNLCKINAVYNGASQATSCSATVTMPTIEAHSNTPNIIGWSTAAGTHTATYTSGQTSVSLTASSNLTYYAQTSSSNSEDLTAAWNANGATLSSSSNSSCSLAKTYNGVAKDTSCTVDAPTITRSGFTITGFNTSNSATTNNSSYNTSTGKLTLTSSNTGSTWYAVTSKVVNLTFSVGANTDSIGATSGSCTIQNSATSCSVKSPTITSNLGYEPCGWNKTDGATSGTAAGNNITDLTADATYFGNSKAIDYTITLNAGTGIGTLTSSGWTGTGSATISKVYHIGDTIDLSAITKGYKTGYSGAAYSKSSGEGSLNNASFTVGAGGATIGIAATTLATPECTMQGGATKVYNRSATTLTATDVSSDYDTDSVDITYSFGYASNGTKALGSFTTAGTSNTLSVARSAFRGTRYYGVKVVVTDKNDNTITSECTSGTNSAAATGTTVANRTTMTLVNSRINFDAATNGGTLVGTSPLYVPYNSKAIYTGRTNSTAATIPIAEKTGYEFTGWYTSGDLKVINADRTVPTTAVSGWINASGNWVKTGTSTSATAAANMLYAQFTTREYTIDYDLNGGTATNPSSYDVDSGAITLADPTKDGWTFTGWSEEISDMAWSSGFINLDTGAVETNPSYPNSYYSEPISLQAGVTYTASGFGSYSGSDVRWRIYSADGTYLGNATGATYTPANDCYVKLLLYNAPTEAQMAGTVITSNLGTSVTLPSGATGNRTYSANYTGKTYTATFYYNSNSNSGSTTLSTETAQCTVTSGSNCSVDIPSTVSGSGGTYNNKYVGLSTSTGNMTAAVDGDATSVALTATRNYYSLYRTEITMYYPSSASASTSKKVYQNQWFTSTSALATTVLSTTSDGTTSNATAGTLVSGYDTLVGYNTAASTNSQNKGATVAALAQSDSGRNAAVIVYQIAKKTENIEATFYYSSSSVGAKTNSKVSGTRTTFLRPTSTTAAGTSVSQGTISAPTTTVPYGTTLKGWATSASTMTTATVNTANTSYYAVYQTTGVRINYYNSSYTTRTDIYRNGVYGSNTNYTMYLATSATGLSNYSTAVGPGNSAWAGLSTASDTTPEYTSVGTYNTGAAYSTTKTFYTVYQFNVTYEKGSGVSSIGTTTGAGVAYCRVNATSTSAGGSSCTVTTPSITPNTGYVSVGWNTTSGAANGTASGSSYTINTNTTKLYANAVGTPTFTSTKNVVTITYPSGCASPYTCQYSTNNGTTWTNSTTNTKSVTLSAQGYVMARVTDGTNPITSSSYTFAPKAENLSYDNATTELPCTDAQCAIDKVKEMLD